MLPRALSALKMLEALCCVLMPPEWGCLHYSKEALHLIDECKGTANISRSECMFSAQIKPYHHYEEMIETSEGSRPLIVVKSYTIYLFFPTKPGQLRVKKRWGAN